MKQSLGEVRREGIKGMVLGLPLTRSLGFLLKRRETIFCDRGKEKECVEMKITFVADGWAVEGDLPKASAFSARKRQNYVLLKMRSPRPRGGLKENYVHAVMLLRGMLEKMIVDKEEHK